MEPTPSADGLRDFDGDPVPLSPPVLEERPDPDDGTPWPDDAGLRGRPLLLHALFGRGYRPRSLGGSSGGLSIGFGGLTAAIVAVPLNAFWLLVAVALFHRGSEEPADYAIAIGIAAIAGALLFVFARNGVECVLLAGRAVRQMREGRARPRLPAAPTPEP